MNRMLIATCALVLALAPAALASAPGATTGEATSITDTSAVLNGTVNPNKEETTYSFEYGTTAGYGSATPTATAGGGNAGKDVSATLTGLAPSTTYHFRLVATNPSGTDFGVDRTFTTAAAGSTAPPPPAHAVTAAAAAATVKFGQPVTITGQVSGPKAAGAEVTLMHTPHPFTAPFAAVATGVADAAGAYSLSATPQVNTQYRVDAKTAPPVSSAVITVLVRPTLGFRVSDSRVRRGRRVRFAGAVAPAHDGTVVRIQRRTRKGWRTVAKTALRAAKRPGRSVYRRRLRIRRTSTYRVRFPAHADHARATSRTRRIRAR